MSYTRFDEISDRIVDLRHELSFLEMSPRHGDAARGDEIQAEIDALEAELAGMRARSSASVRGS